METKICNKCKKEKNIEEYRLKKQNKKYIRYYICKECEKIENKNCCKKYRENHKEQLSKYNKKYRWNMNGIIVINKPKGFTSQDVVSKVKRILNIKIQ